MSLSLKGFKFVNNSGKTVIMSIKIGTELKAQDTLKAGENNVYTISKLCQINDDAKINLTARYQDAQTEVSCEFIYDKKYFVDEEDTAVTVVTKNGKLNINAERTVKNYSKIVVTNHAAVVAVFKVYKMDGTKVGDSHNKTVGYSWSASLKDMLTPNEKFKVACSVKAGKDPGSVYGYFDKNSEATLNLELKGTTLSNHFNIL